DTSTTAPMTCATRPVAGPAATLAAAAFAPAAAGLRAAGAFAAALGAAAAFGAAAALAAVAGAFFGVAALAMVEPLWSFVRLSRRPAWDVALYPFTAIRDAKTAPRVPDCSRAPRRPK